MGSETKYLLQESQMPRFWYNIQADLPAPLPVVLHPATMQPIAPGDLAPIFPMSLIEQEVSTAREVEIPEPVREVFRLWRPAPLYRAHRLEKALGTPAKIFYKYEGVSPAGSHKPNTAIPQAWYNAQAGVRRQEPISVGNIPRVAVRGGWMQGAARCPCSMPGQALQRCRRRP